ncbi:hypothetical protein Ahu01nite_024860 [Winogradskya humida]|uniref:Uncharacterized protein n=1 Tax=Winogradskya humida TaxID=113566 RepID=A0ABQ3ZLD9_9ACTN|nr:hypothetical protein Ahu01nite_024860 [Actinoplanes humidus]
MTLACAAELLTVRDVGRDRAVAEALADEVGWWLHRQDELITQLQRLLAQLQLYKYEDTRDSSALYLATVMLADVVVRMSPSEVTDRRAEELVLVLVKHFRATGEVDSLDRAEQACQKYPAVGALYLPQVRKMRGQPA